MPTLEQLGRQLQADLKTIQDLQQRYGGDTIDLGAMLRAKQGRDAPVKRQRRGKRRKKAAKAAVAQSPSPICRALLGPEWHDVDFYWEKVKEVLPQTSRQVVATALRREHDAGGAEKRGDRKAGVEFRKA